MADDTFRSFPWEEHYSTSDFRDGEAGDILHDFYLPALARARQYDRVAGYFRSSSLAAASEGYTAFLRHGGTMRLIVGTDLAAADVAAILAGDEERFARLLTDELSGAETWPEDVRDGVSLLARMVAAQHLEVRVALRVHAKTGAPLAVDATDDGYVHEKWFVLEDAAGDRMYGGGSLNESRTALARNAENIDVSCAWWGAHDERRVARCKENFERLWTGRHPALRVLALPEAVKQHLVRLKDLTGAPTEIDGTQLLPPAVPSLRELLTFSLLHDAPRMPGGIYLGMYSAPVAPWPHQEMVARRLIETWPYAYLLCDEVGLGKTIEAALALRSLMLSGRIRRVLIAAPASLTAQWQSELMEKALLPFVRSVPKPGRPDGISHQRPDGSETVDTDLYAPDANIVSTGLLARKGRQTLLSRARDFDAVLVDEAHYARRSNPTQGADAPPRYTNLYQSIQQALAKKTRSLWLATATPMQIHPIEVYDLLRLTGRVGPYHDAPALTLSYFEALGTLAAERAKRTAGILPPSVWTLFGRTFAMLRESDPALDALLHETVVDGRNRRDLQRIAGKPPMNAAVPNLVKPLYAASPLARVMMRHTRALLWEYQRHDAFHIKLAKRQVLPLDPIAFTAEEARFYRALTQYTADLSRAIRECSPNARQVLVFFLNFLQLRVSSSSYAIEQTLLRRKRRVDVTLQYAQGAAKAGGREPLPSFTADDFDADDANENDWEDAAEDLLLKDRSEKDLRWEANALARLLDELHAMRQTPSKLQRLLELLGGRRDLSRDGTHLRQTVVFTRFFDTLQSIRQILQGRLPGLSLGVFSGRECSRVDPATGRTLAATREDVKAAFLRGDIELLLCTDAAAEGLNLQTADYLINFDMGWNPMKIEQRIGRIDRIGQRHSTVYVYHMIYAGSIEEKVYCTLAERMREAGLVVGTQAVTMLPVKPDDFRELFQEERKATAVCDPPAGAEAPAPTHSEALDELARRTKERLREQKKAEASLELTAAEQYDIYQKEHARMETRRTPATLEDLWDALGASPYLRACGGAWKETVEGAVYDLPGNARFPRMHGTKSRERAGRAQPFLTWGEAQIDTLLRTMADAFDAAEHPNVQRLVVKQTLPQKAGRAKSTFAWETIGYAVQTPAGPQLVTSCKELQDIELSETPLTEKDIAALHQSLQQRAREEASLLSSVAAILQKNAQQASLQSNLTRDVAIALLERMQGEGYEKYKSIHAELESHEKKLYPLDLPLSPYAGNEARLLFPVTMQRDCMHINVPPVLRKAALALCDRISFQLKKSGRKLKPADQTAEDILRALRKKG